jgi:triosephosphate isomerase
MKKMVIANWKMNPVTLEEAEKLFSNIAKNIAPIKNTQIIICPPFLYLENLKKISRKIDLGAQNASLEEGGAHTGEISATMLYEAGIKYVLLGHSERRALGENNSDINKKIKIALSSGLVPILCVGDKERDANHEYFGMIKNQIEECLAGIQKNAISKVIIAYEPIWAISTTPGRKDATTDDSYEMAIFIRKVIIDKIGATVKMPKILYGGSVNDKNSGEFLARGGVDGVLVGGASLRAEKFLKIISIAEK